MPIEPWVIAQENAYMAQRAAKHTAVQLSDLSKRVDNLTVEVKIMTVVLVAKAMFVIFKGIFLRHPGGRTCNG